MKKIVLLLLPVIFLMQACKEDPVSPPPPDAGAKSVYVINEGGYGQNNSSITLYDLEKETALQNVYQSANNAPLGDVANSMVIYGNKGYITVDNSNKIEIIDINSFKSLGFIDLGANGSPRELVIIDSTVGYVTSLNLGQVIKFNPSAMTVTKNIGIGSFPEGIAASNGRLFAANSGFGASNEVSVIDMSTDTEVKKIQVGYNPRIILKDYDGFIYAVCTGSFTDTAAASGVYRIDPAAMTVTDSIMIKKNPGEACMVSGSRMFVVNSDGVIDVNLNSKTASAEPLISGMTVNSFYGTIYSITYDAGSGNIYCGNPKDFNQNGEIAVFDLSGKEKFRFDTGLYPGTIVIR